MGAEGGPLDERDEFLYRNLEHVEIREKRKFHSAMVVFLFGGSIWFVFFGTRNTEMFAG